MCVAAAFDISTRAVTVSTFHVMTVTTFISPSRPLLLPHMLLKLVANADTRVEAFGALIAHSDVVVIGCDN